MRKTIAALAVALTGCSPGNLEYVKERGPDRWPEVGFEVVGYSGYQWGPLGFGTPYGGACVWWELRKIPDNGITYSGCLKRWGDTLEVYGTRARDAIQPRNL
jgi:hypothetical protein